jgi:hypothetical protein
MDFSRATTLYDAPFPSDDLVVHGRVDVSRFPNPRHIEYVEQYRALLARNDGFATSAGIFFRLTGALDPARLPDLAETIGANAPVFLVGVDAGAPDRGERYPVTVTFEADGGSYGAPDLLTLLPLQGVALRPHTRYAAVVTTDLLDVSGQPLAAASADTLARFGDTVTELALPPSRIAGLTVFTTGDPTRELTIVRDAALAMPLPRPEQLFARTDVFEDFCVYHTTIAVPDWQGGTPPFQTPALGGTWQFAADGTPIVQRVEDANLVLTIPRQAMPEAGFPLLVFVRTGGGVDRPLVDRGQVVSPGAFLVVPGEGPARYLARAGFAGLSVDGPLGGLRNTTMADEQFAIFNVENGGAIRDNLRESALEIALIAHVAGSLHLAARDCPPAGTSELGPADVSFDAGHFGVMGHSTGATIATIAASIEPLYRVLILSGAGGSWIENIMFKQKPLVIAPVAELLLRDDIPLAEDAPALSLVQWALEPSDPPVYAGRMREGPQPRHVLMEQGIVDEYILPRIANASSLALGLDLAGRELDTERDPRLADQQPIGPLLDLIGRQMIALPASGNSGTSTTVLVQQPEDGVEDGHEVVFQTDGPKHQIECFLASWLATGTPSVPANAGRDQPCPGRAMP